jgi:hypothetical protein
MAVAGRREERNAADEPLSPFDRYGGHWAQMEVKRFVER